MVAIGRSGRSARPADLPCVEQHTPLEPPLGMHASHHLAGGLHELSLAERLGRVVGGEPDDECRRWKAPAGMVTGELVTGVGIGKGLRRYGVGTG